MQINNTCLLPFCISPKSSKQIAQLMTHAASLFASTSSAIGIFSLRASNGPLRICGLRIGTGGLDIERPLFDMVSGPEYPTIITLSSKAWDPVITLVDSKF